MEHDAQTSLPCLPSLYRRRCHLASSTRLRTSPGRFAAFWPKQPLVQRVGDANSPASPAPRPRSRPGAAHQRRDSLTACIMGQAPCRYPATSHSKVHTSVYPTLSNRNPTTTAPKKRGRDPKSQNTVTLTATATSVAQTLISNGRLPLAASFFNVIAARVGTSTHRRIDASTPTPTPTTTFPSYPSFPTIPCPAPTTTSAPNPAIPFPLEINGFIHIQNWRGKMHLRARRLDGRPFCLLILILVPPLMLQAQGRSRNRRVDLRHVRKDSWC